MSRALGMNRRRSTYPEARDIRVCGSNYRTLHFRVLKSPKCSSGGNTWDTLVRLVDRIIEARLCTRPHHLVLFSSSRASQGEPHLGEPRLGELRRRGPGVGNWKDWGLKRQRRFPHHLRARKERFGSAKHMHGRHIGYQTSVLVA